jgi:hypothetical protein
MEERTITFNSYELGAIDIVVINEIYNCKKRLEENEFTYQDDKMSCKAFLQQLESAHNKINRKEVLTNV